MRRIRSFTCAVLVVVVLAAVAAGCTKPLPTPEWKKVAVLDPMLMKEMTIDGQLITSNRGETISLDGKYLLAGVRRDRVETMSAVPLAESAAEASSAQKQEPIVLYSVDSSWAKNNLVQWYPVGWLSDTECVFIVHGWQSQGEHKGKRGAAIFTGDLAAEKTTEIGFVPVPTQGDLVDEAVLAASGKVYMQVSRGLWEIDVATGGTRQIRERINENYGIQTARMSPTGTHVVYQEYTGEKRGVILIDAATGEEKVLLPMGDTLSFYPTWSPDGKYIAAYTADKLASSVGSTPVYALIPGEDGPMSSGQAITVVDLDGKVVKTIAIDGKYVHHFSWLSDNESLVFVAGEVAFGKWGEVTSLDYATAHIASVTADAPVQVADISAIEKETGRNASWLFPVGSLPQGKGAVIDIVGADGDASIWRVSTGAAPLKVADGWWGNARLRPQYMDSIAGVISTGSQSGLWLVGEKAAKFGTGPSGTEFYAYNKDLLVAGSYDFSANRTSVSVYNMVQEKVVEE